MLALANHRLVCTRRKQRKHSTARKNVYSLESVGSIFLDFHLTAFCAGTAILAVVLQWQRILPGHAAYDPNNPKYRELSSWFWEQYTTYGGSWRDQPLWAYTMHHFGAKPVVMTHDKHITRGGDLFITGGTIGWDQHVHVPK